MTEGRWAWRVTLSGIIRNFYFFPFIAHLSFPSFVLSFCPSFRLFMTSPLWFFPFLPSWFDPLSLAPLLLLLFLSEYSYPSPLTSSLHPHSPSIPPSHKSSALHLRSSSSLIPPFFQHYLHSLTPREVLGGEGGRHDHSWGDWGGNLWLLVSKALH